MSDSIQGVSVGDTATFEKTVSEQDIVDFARVTGEEQPLHLDDAYAATTRFKRRIAHGMLSAGFISAALGIKVGDTASFEKRVSEEDIVAFAHATGDEQPLHLDDSYAAKTRFKRRVAHGMLSAGLISAALGTKLANASRL